MRVRKVVCLVATVILVAQIIFYFAFTSSSLPLRSQDGKNNRVSNTPKISGPSSQGDPSKPTSPVSIPTPLRPEPPSLPPPTGSAQRTLLAEFTGARFPVQHHLPASSLPPNALPMCQ